MDFISRLCLTISLSKYYRKISVIKPEMGEPIAIPLWVLVKVLFKIEIILYQNSVQQVKYLCLYGGVNVVKAQEKFSDMEGFSDGDINT
jgi:hypothetical protein